MESNATHSEASAAARERRSEKRYPAEDDAIVTILACGEEARSRQEPPEAGECLFFLLVNFEAGSGWEWPTKGKKQQAPGTVRLKASRVLNFYHKVFIVEWLPFGR